MFSPCRLISLVFAALLISSCSTEYPQSCPASTPIGLLDADENGGSAESPLEPHLHFGIRAGQTADYPGRGEWRWMAGWIRLCPQDLGWLQPSLVITSQEIPPGGYPQPDVPFWIRWGLELIITSLYTICGTGILVEAIRKKWRLFLIFPGVLLIAAGIVLHNNRILSTYVLLAIGILVLTVGIFHYIRYPVSKSLNKA